MKKLKKELKKIIRYYFKFGFYGILFFIRTFFSNNRIISFAHSKYIHPIYLRNKSSDMPTFDQIFLNEDYKINLNFIPNVIVDCGANIGLASVYFKNKFPTAKIISIEPEKSNF